MLGAVRRAPVGARRHRIDGWILAARRSRMRFDTCYAFNGQADADR